MSDTTEPTELAATTTTTTTLLSADDILGADDAQYKMVKVPEWGGTVRVKGLDGTARDAYVASLSMIDPRTKERVPNNTNATAKLLSHCIVGMDGEPLFSNAHVAALGRKNGGALQRVSDVAERLSGLGAAAEKDAEGNSEPTARDGSASADSA